MSHSKSKRFNVKTRKGKIIEREMFYFNPKELQADVKVFCVIIGAIGFCLFNSPPVGEGGVFISA